MTSTLAELLKDSAYRLTQFKAEFIEALEQSITLKASAKLSTPYVKCLVRGKPIKLTPEEAVQWNDDPKAGPLCTRQDDYPIFFATMKEPSKDNSGDKIYVKLSDIDAWDAAPKPNDPKASEPLARYNASPKELDEFVLDDHEHLVVKHDLFSHSLKGGKRTPAGIAEAFAEFANKEKLGFFR